MRVCKAAGCSGQALWHAHVTAGACEAEDLQCMQDSLAEVPVYAHVKEVHLSNGSLEALEITYITFYAHNGWYALLGWGPHVGAHDGDWEHLTVRLQAPAYDCQVCPCSSCMPGIPPSCRPVTSSSMPANCEPSLTHALGIRHRACSCRCSRIHAFTSMTAELFVQHREVPVLLLQGVWFNAHRPWDGCWVPAHEVERTAEGRPIAYVALHGHGTYPHVRAPAFGCCHAIIACITSHTCQRGLFYSSLLSCLGSLDCSALIRLHEQDVSWLLALAHCR